MGCDTFLTGFVPIDVDLFHLYVSKLNKREKQEIKHISIRVQILIKVNQLLDRKWDRFNISDLVLSNQPSQFTTLHRF